jgi:hypothetical protein
MTIADNLQLEAFAREFLDAYFEHGFTTMGKREIDLLVLRLIIEHSEGWSWEDPPTAFELSQKLRAKRSRIRSMMDELSFRHLADEDRARIRLRKVIEDRIREDGDQVFEESRVRIQIEDGFLREFAKDLVQKDYGIVDSSFNSSIIVLSGDKFLALVFEVLPESAREKVEKELERHKEELSATKQRGLFRMFIEQAVKGAGAEGGKQAVRFGVAALTGGAFEVGGFVDWFMQKMRGEDPGDPPAAESVEV